MPASTPVYGLPYMVGSDPPCFGPGTGCDNLVSVFCEFAEIVEALLDDNDDIVARTAAAIPMAMIEVRPETPLDVNNFFTVPFDTVIFDTDNMVAAGDDGFEIRPPRNGQYHIDFVCSVNETTGATFDGLPVRFEMSIGNDELAVNVGIATAPGILIPNGDTWLRASTLYQFSGTAPIPRSIVIDEAGGTFPDLTLTYANMAVYWHSDL